MKTNTKNVNSESALLILTQLGPGGAEIQVTCEMGPLLTGLFSIVNFLLQSNEQSMNCPNNLIACLESRCYCCNQISDWVPLDSGESIPILVNIGMPYTLGKVLF